jgi:adenylate kinase family enzyme
MSLDLVTTEAQKPPIRGGYGVLVPVVLVTGMSGSGKSTTLAELARRGHRVVDTDYGGFSEEVREWEQLWREDRIGALLDQHDDGVLFISGCVSNQAKSTRGSMRSCC